MNSIRPLDRLQIIRYVKYPVIRRRDRAPYYNPAATDLLLVPTPVEVGVFK